MGELLDARDGPSEAIDRLKLPGEKPRRGDSQMEGEVRAPRSGYLMGTLAALRPTV